MVFDTHSNQNVNSNQSLSSKFDELAKNLAVLVYRYEKTWVLGDRNNNCSFLSEFGRNSFFKMEQKAK